MHPPRFPHSGYVAHQGQWQPHRPRFGPMWPIQYNFNSNRHAFPNNYEDYWCETCDRGFRTSEILLKHKQQHQKCNIDGCQFIAHPKVITKHIQMQHSTGLYKKIAKLDNPEEIQKWREERKRRYPTKENIEKKNAEIKEKIDRGEKMNMRRPRENLKEQGLKRRWTQDNRKNFKKKFSANRSFTKVENKGLTTEHKKPLVQPQKLNKLIHQVDDSKTLKPFTGILNLLDDSDNDEVLGDTVVSNPIEDDDYIIIDESHDKTDSTITEPVVCGALSSLICNYESSDEESGHNNLQLLHNKVENLNTIINNSIKPNVSLEPNDCLKNEISALNNSIKSDDDSGPEEVKTDKKVDASTSCNNNLSNGESFKRTNRRGKQDSNITKTTKHNTKKYKSKLPSTLLEKLLHNEIRQERNIVLQCIRYIVKNNYFEKK